MGQSYKDWYGGRRRSRRNLLRGLGGAGLVALTAGCASPLPSAMVVPAATAAASAPTAAAAPGVTPTAAARTPKRGGVFRRGSTGSWPHLDVHQTSNTLVFGNGIGVAYSRLLKYQLKDVKLPATVPIPDIAASWEQPDEVTYVFKLRPNVKWQNLPPVNGRPLVPEDIVFSFERQMTPGYPNASILGNLAKMEVVDRGTLKLTARQPSADFLVDLAAPFCVIVPREIIEQKGDLKEGPMIGTGPFILEKIDSTGTSVARRNPDYFIPGQPYIDTFEFTVIPDSATLVASFRAGNFDNLQPAITTRQEVTALRRVIPGLQVESVKGLGSGSELGLKLDRPPFNDLRVRQAIYKAIDARAIIEAAYDTGWLTVGLPLPSVDWALPEDEIGRLYQRDLEGARRLLREAGYENGIEFTLTVGNLTPAFIPAGELMKAQLEEANIRVSLRVIDSTTFSTQVQTRGEFEAYIGTGGALPSADAVLFSKYHSKGSRNVTKLNDPKLDALIERQTTFGRDPNARKQALLEIQRYIIEQAYVRFFHTFEADTASLPFVRDYFIGFGILNLEGDRYALVWLDK